VGAGCFLEAMPALRPETGTLGQLRELSAFAAHFPLFCLLAKKKPSGVHLNDKLPVIV